MKIMLIVMFMGQPLHTQYFKGWGRCEQAKGIIIAAAQQQGMSPYYPSYVACTALTNK